MISFTRIALFSFCHQQFNLNPKRIFNLSNVRTSRGRSINTRTVASSTASTATTRTAVSSLLTLAVFSASSCNYNIGNIRTGGGLIQATHCYSSSSSTATTSRSVATAAAAAAAAATAAAAARTSTTHTNTVRGNSRLMMSSKASETMNEANHHLNLNLDQELLFDTGFLNAKDAYELDQQLFSTGYTLEQLMELAGLAVAEAVYDISPPTLPTLPTPPTLAVTPKKNVLIVCGPGNNGGDGLVAARHLVMFGYDVVVVYPKRSSREEHYAKLVKQCEDVGISIYDSIPFNKHNADINSNDTENEVHRSEEEDFTTVKYDVIIDAIFGFSFKGEAREPFGTIIQQMIDIQQQENVPIVAVDVPSGWNVDEGDVANTGMVPDVLVSLTAPKLCSKEFQGRHFVGGRFLPPNIAQKYGIQMPPYPGVRQVMEITATKNNNEKKPIDNNEKDNEGDGDDDWLAQYAAYCAEKEQKLSDADNELESSTRINEDGVEEWAIQYHNYCIEKEAKLKELEEKAHKEKMESREETEDWSLEYEKYLHEKNERMNKDP